MPSIAPLLRPDELMPTKFRAGNTLYHRLEVTHIIGRTNCSENLSKGYGSIHAIHGSSKIAKQSKIDDGSS